MPNFLSCCPINTWTEQSQQPNRTLPSQAATNISLFAIFSEERKRITEVPALNPYPGYYFFHPSLLFSHHFIRENYVHWTQTPDSHIYSADIPGVRKENIRVELEDSRYLIIRTEAADESTVEPGRSFNRKFRLPRDVDVNGISAEYVDGVLTVTVPRSYVRRGLIIDPADRPENLHRLASAA